MANGDGNPVSTFPKKVLKMTVLEDFDDEFDQKRHREKRGVLRKGDSETIEIVDGAVKKFGKDTNCDIVIPD